MKRPLVKEAAGNSSVHVEMSARPPAPNAFLNGTNYEKIVGFLKQHYAKKLGTPVPDKLTSRIQKTVQHYMQEVNRVQGGRPVNVLTTEVLKETTLSMDNWLKRQESGLPSAITTVGAFSRPPPEESRLYEDTGTSYERLMAERAPPPVFQPPMPDFRTSGDMLESNEDPVVLMQRLQKERESQMRAMSTATESSTSNSVVGGSLGPRLEIREDVQPSAGRPVPPQAELPPPLLAPRPQDYIIPQEDVVKYRETEYNIFLTSSDRDWLRNRTENRYNFSVNFNTGTKKSGFSFNAALQERFKNIQRVEFVKAIVPIESLTTLVKITSESPSLVYDTTRVVNVFSLPFASVRIAELNSGNGFSTKPEEDNTFAMVQYDTTWSSDLTAQAVTGTAPAPVLTKSGYTGLIPKFLKCQRVYSPTPLGTLQRMSIRVDRHSGALLSDDSDVFSVGRICMSGNFSTIGTDSTVYSVDAANVENSYIFIRTGTYFPFSAVAEGDTIQIKGFTTVSTTAAAIDFAAWINRDDGHYVVAQGYVDAAGALNDGRNAQGYCNVIILRSRFNDPTTGSTYRTNAYFGGSLAAENILAADLDNVTNEPDQTGCALINFSRQTHFVLRIITRDMDSSSNIRPDNAQ
jgi:hypothetical protein